MNGVEEVLKVIQRLTFCTAVAEIEVHVFTGVLNGRHLLLKECMPAWI
jgi:hypothetical protein